MTVILTFELVKKKQLKNWLIWRQIVIVARRFLNISKCQQSESNVSSRSLETTTAGYTTRVDQETDWVENPKDTILMESLKEEDVLRTLLEGTETPRKKLLKSRPNMFDFFLQSGHLRTTRTWWSPCWPGPGTPRTKSSLKNGSRNTRSSKTHRSVRLQI